MRKVLATLAVAGLVWTVQAQAASLREVGPLAPASQIIAARGSSAGPVLRLTFAVDGNSRAVVDIASDYDFARRTAGATLIDYRLKRIMTVEGTLFSNISLYERADFRYREAYNRRYLRKLLRESIKPDAPPLHPFWDQQELGMVLPDDEAATVERRATATGGLQFIVEGRTASSFEPSDKTVSTQEMQEVMRFLHSLSLHPDLLAAIGSSGHLPAVISFTTRFDNKREEWKLLTVEHANAGYPLTPDLKPELLTDGGGKNLAEPMRDLLPIMLDAVSGRSQPRSIESYRAAIAEARAQNRVLQHYILENELSLQYNLGTMACLNKNITTGDCSNAKDTVHWWAADPVTYSLIESMGTEQTDQKAAIAKRQAIPRNGLSDAYMLDLWIGNSMVESGALENGVSLLGKAIKGNPFVGGFYNDLGNAFSYAYLPTEAWLCYDLAQLLPGSENMPIIEFVQKKKSFLEAKFPELF